MKKKTLNLIYVPCANLREAKKIAKFCLNENLCACANILPMNCSLYKWKGKIVESKEVLLLLKTTSAKSEELKERIRQKHSYELPCIATISIDDVNKEFLDWVKAQSR